MYPKFSGVPSTIPLHARTSSTVVSNARCPHTSTPSIASSLAPATTASVIACVPPEREWKTTSSRLGSATANRLALFHEARQVEAEVLPNVADLIDEDVPAVETPLVAGSGERVVVAPGDDRLQRKLRRLLEHDEGGAGRGRSADLVDVDDHVAGEVARAQGAVGVHPVGAGVERADGFGTLDRT